MLRITIGNLTFSAEFESKRAPKTVAAIRGILPIEGNLLQARWSGESAWVPMGDRRIGIDFENHTTYPAPGELLVYPGGMSEMEILVPYGATRFASRVGDLAGNHFATIKATRDELSEIGRLVTWNGVQSFRMELFD